MKAAYQILTSIAILCLLTSSGYCDVNGKISLTLQWQPTEGQLDRKDFRTYNLKIFSEKNSG
jgi:hypothetical protein